MTYAGFEPEGMVFAGAVEDKADADLQRLLMWTNSFPKPAPGKAVRADALLGALRQLVPLATRIAKLLDGAKKGGYSGSGFLTGPTVTTADKAIANRILYEVNERLPAYGMAAVERDLLEQIRGASQRLLMIASDLNLDQTLLDHAARGWKAYGAALTEQVFVSQQKGYAKLVNQTKYAAMRIAEADEAADAAADIGKIPFSDMFTPGELKADIAALNGRVKAFGDDVSGTPTDDEKILGYRSRFAAWFNQYFEWFASIDGTVSYSLNSTRDRARQYSDELKAWVNEWKGMGGKIVSETAIAPPRKDIGGRGRDQQTPDSSMLETALLIGGLGLGALAVVTVLKK